jgi:hypothetical protein
MSDSFRTLLHEQATSVSFKPPDLEHITRAGGRRLRRRRIAAALATAAAVALAGSATAVMVDRGADQRPPSRPAGPWPADAVSWALDTTIYVDSGEGVVEPVEVGHRVHAYVRTATGFVVLDGSDAVYAVTQDGVTVIGQMNDSLPDNTDDQRLVVNSGGTLVGWVDEAASPEGLTVRIYDALDGSTRDFPFPLTTPDVHALPGVALFAIDDRTAYWRTYEGIHRVDLDTGGDRLVAARTDMHPGDRIYSFEVYSAEHGMLAFSPDDDRTFLAGPSVEDAREVYDFGEVTPLLPEPEGDAEVVTGHHDPVRLSPTGAWLSFTRADVVATPVGDPQDGGAEFSDWRLTPVVLDPATGEQIDLPFPADTVLALASVWLDDDVLQVVELESSPPQPGILPTRVVFWECMIPVGTCHRAAELGPPLPEPFIPVFPDGRWYGSQ